MRFAVPLLVTLTACSSAMVGEAERGEWPSLGARLAEGEARATLSTDRAADVARAVLEREILAAPDEAYALSRIDDASACAFDADDVLARRAEKGDVAAAEAARVRSEAGLMSASDAREHLSSSSDRWRAVGVSGLVREADRDARRRALADGSLWVRKAALSAVLRAKAPGDFDAVWEVARLDPDPLARTLAVRALPTLAGGRPDVAVKLRDLWDSADDPLRTDIAVALALPGVIDHGGRQALVQLLSEGAGEAQVAAAGAILSSLGPRDDAELDALSRHVLVGALLGPSRRARIHAIAVVPLPPRGDPEPQVTWEALTHALDSGDRDVALSAASRLASPRAGGAPPLERRAALLLETLAAPTDPNPTRAGRARFALAEAGDVRIQAWLEGDLHARAPDLRVNAAEALAALGRASRAAPILADTDPSVRVRGACVILQAARRGGGSEL